MEAPRIKSRAFNPSISPNVGLNLAQPQQLNVDIAPIFDMIRAFKKDADALKVENFLTTESTWYLKEYEKRMQGKTAAERVETLETLRVEFQGHLKEKGFDSGAEAKAEQYFRTTIYLPLLSKAIEAMPGEAEATNNAALDATIANFYRYHYYKGGVLSEENAKTEQEAIKSMGKDGSLNQNAAGTVLKSISTMPQTWKNIAQELGERIKPYFLVPKEGGGETHHQMYSSNEQAKRAWILKQNNVLAKLVEDDWKKKGPSFRDKIYSGEAEIPHINAMGKMVMLPIGELGDDIISASGKRMTSLQANMIKSLQEWDELGAKDLEIANKQAKEKQKQYDMEFQHKFLQAVSTQVLGGINPADIPEYQRLSPEAQRQFDEKIKTLEEWGTPAIDKLNFARSAIQAAIELADPEKAQKMYYQFINGEPIDLDNGDQLSYAVNEYWSQDEDGIKEQILLYDFLTSPAGRKMEKELSTKLLTIIGKQQDAGEATVKYHKKLLYREIMGFEVEAGILSKMKANISGSIDDILSKLANDFMQQVEHLTANTPEVMAEIDKKFQVFISRYAGSFWKSGDKRSNDTLNDYLVTKVTSLLGRENETSFSITPSNSLAYETKKEWNNELKTFDLNSDNELMFGTGEKNSELAKAMLSKKNMEHVNTALRQRGWQQQDIRKLRTLLILLDRRIGEGDAKEKDSKKGSKAGSVAGSEGQVLQKIAEGDTP